MPLSKPSVLSIPRSLRSFVALSLLMLFALVACAPVQDDPTASVATAARQSLVATRGAEVMPFDLERTTHIFEKMEDGGLQQVVADDATDAGQIALIRAHLAEEAERFQQGDFHDPTMIHGEDMAGLHELMSGAAHVDIGYSELPDGAQIRYTTADAALVAALHAWFDAQLADHGAHAADH